MNSQLIPFQFESFQIRVLLQDGDPWWVAADVCAALEIGNPSMALTRLDDDEKGISSIDTLGGKQEVSIINEPGLYSLILGSRKQEARGFKRWVTHEVVPSIRKTGRYEAKPVAPHADTRVALDLFSTSAKAARAAGFKGNMIALSAGNFTKTITGVDVLSLMGATHLLADPRGMTYTPTELGKLCDPPLGPAKVNRMLEAAGLQSREFDRWLPTDAARDLCEWLDTGKRHSNGAPVKQVKWFRSVLDKVA